MKYRLFFYAFISIVIAVIIVHGSSGSLGYENESENDKKEINKLETAIKYEWEEKTFIEAKRDHYIMLTRQIQTTNAYHIETLAADERDSISVDKKYLQALQIFYRALTNRTMAEEMEMKVYRDHLGDGYSTF